MPYKILIHETAEGELADLRAYDERKIISAIEKKLSETPTQVSRNQKCLEGFHPDFEHVEPIWELRVGDFRVFYDVEEDEQLVNVRAVRHKGRATTEDVA